MRMEMVQAKELIYEYEKRDEEGNVIGMSRAIDGLPQRVRRCPKSKGIFAGSVGIVPHCNIFRYFWRCKSTVLIDFTFLMSIHFPKG